MRVSVETWYLLLSLCLFSFDFFLFLSNTHFRFSIGRIELKKGKEESLSHNTVVEERNRQLRQPLVVMDIVNYFLFVCLLVFSSL